MSGVRITASAQQRPLPAGPDHERTIGRILTVLTYSAVALLTVGLVLMFAAGIPPTAAWPALDLISLPGRALAGEPAAFLWFGLLVVIATPIVRVVVAAIAYVNGREWRMLAVSVGILTVIAVGVAAAVLTEH